MQPEFLDFQNLVQGFGFVSKEAIFEGKEFQKATRWDFERPVTQEWSNSLYLEKILSFHYIIVCLF